MRRRLIVLAGSIALALTACGGGDDDAAETTEAPADTGTEVDSDSASEPEAPAETESEPESTDAPAETEPEAAASGTQGTGTSTVGDTTWEFALGGQDGPELCDPDLSGMFTVQMFGKDESGQLIFILLQAPVSGSGGDAFVETGVGGFEEWRADSNVYDEYSMVEGLVIPEGVGATFEISGNTISGSGTFYEEVAMQNARASGVYDAGSREGVFSVTCPSS